MPFLPIPPALCGAEPGSFAQDTVVRRLPEIASRVVTENSFDESTNRRIFELVADLPHGRIRSLLDLQAADCQSWQSALQPFFGLTWLEAPLFVTEMYFYRRILEATGYFVPGPGFMLDPYSLQKQLGLEQAVPALQQALPAGLSTARADLGLLVHMSLWGNQSDLSLWPVKGQGGGRVQAQPGSAALLVDQTEMALAHLRSLQSGRIDFLLDNTGTELCFDLLLAGVLLDRYPGITIRLNAKPHPCFVSDALETDVLKALHSLKTSSLDWTRSLAEGLERAVSAGRLILATHFYWASPNPAWEMPAGLRADLEQSSLIISKGDVNYRRWLGDVRWPADTPLDQIIDPPAPLLLLRVPKSDVAAGLQPGQAAELSARDPAWMTDGHWGMIQFVE